MFLALFSIIDILAATSLLFPNPLGIYIGAIAAIKGLASLIGGLGAKDMVFSFLGLVDILAGLALIFVFDIPWLWLVVMLKGLVSLATSLAK